VATFSGEGQYLGCCESADLLALFDDPLELECGDP
jgi:hypothetical protein